ncbi:MAG: phosphatidylserine/phosphatidylglycerophosphate/cardiolipin synthase family protein [Gammaproteobacteria bacterium]
MKNRTGIALSIGLSAILPFAFPESVIDGVRIQCEEGFHELKASLATFFNKLGFDSLSLVVCCNRPANWSPDFSGERGNSILTPALSKVTNSRPRHFLRFAGSFTFLLLMALLAGTLTGCSSLKPVMDSDSLMQAPGHPSVQVVSVRHGKLGDSDRSNTSSRPAAALVQGATVLVETTIFDPIIRPVSFAKAYYGLTIKSVGGFLQRTAINRFHFPALERKPIPPVADAPAMDLKAWERELDEIVGAGASLGEIRFLIDGDEYFPRLTDAINDAEDAIDIRTYIFDNDDVGLEFADILREKSIEVDVKVLVDGLGNLVATNSDSDSMPADLELPASITNYLRYDSKVRVRIQSNPWFTGDHVKTTIIDQKLAFLGGMNIGREYRYDWHDMMMEVTGPVVKQLQFEFDKTWVKSGFLGDFALFARTVRGYTRDPNKNGYPIRVMTTAIHNSQIYRAQIAAIRRANNRIFIQNAYFSDDTILYELAKARRRGVDVRVIVSSLNDNGAMKLSNEVTVNTMLKNGIRVYSYPGMTHVKAALYDGWACLGSANFDKMSLQINQEINLGISHPATVQKLIDRIFIPDFAASTELHEPIPLRWTHRFAELIADEIL